MMLEGPVKPVIGSLTSHVRGNKTRYFLIKTAAKPEITAREMAAN